MGTSKIELFTSEQNRIAECAKALAHPARIAILEYLSRARECVNKELVEELGLAQSTISQHLTELKKAGLVRGTISGVRVNYCLDVEVWNEHREILSAFLGPIDPFEIKCC